jgi:hypothetical protein
METAKIIYGSYPFAMLHLDDNGCGGIAFYIKRHPVIGMSLRACDTLTLEGNAPVPADIIKCGSCRRPLMDFKIANIRNRKEEIKN